MPRIQANSVKNPPPYHPHAARMDYFQNYPEDFTIGGLTGSADSVSLPAATHEPDPV